MHASHSSAADAAVSVLATHSTPGFARSSAGMGRAYYAPEPRTPCARYPWDGISGVRPYRGFASTTTVGLY